MLERLSKEFIDCQVVHATSIELDIVESIHEFCIANVADYMDTNTHDDCVKVLSGEHTNNFIPYFTYEVLQNLMNDIAPIGCYFGSHEGDATQGFWQIIDVDFVMSDYEEVSRLPYVRDGYTVLSHQNNTVIDDLGDFDEFLNDHTYDVYSYSHLNQIVDIQDTEHAELMKSFIIAEIMPLIAPKGFVWRVNELGDYGLYPELPSYTVTKGSTEYIETVAMLRSASVITKLLYIIKNKRTRKLVDNIDLLPICLDILHDTHFTPFYMAFNEAKAMTPQNITTYLAENDKALNWVINTFFADDFKRNIDTILGSQDVTIWFKSCVELTVNEKNKPIDGIIWEDVYWLRESCDICENIEDTESNEWGDKDCVCLPYDSVNNVWLVGDYEFFNELSKHGAITYESRNYAFYLSTEYGNRLGDIYLKRAWMTHNGESYVRVLV